MTPNSRSEGVQYMMTPNSKSRRVQGILTSWGARPGSDVKMTLQEQEGEGHDDQLGSGARLIPRPRKRAQAWAKFKKKDKPLRTEMALKERVFQFKITIFEEKYRIIANATETVPAAVRIRNRCQD